MSAHLTDAELQQRADDLARRLAANAQPSDSVVVMELANRLMFASLRVSPAVSSTPIPSFLTKEAA